MQIEEGKTYRDEHGNRIGPLTGGMFKWVVGRSQDPDAEWGNDGKVIMRGPEGYGDIIAEWTDGPVRTVTRTVTEIVPGNYGVVSVRVAHPGKEGTANVYLPASHMTPSELRAAAAVLLELAGALE